MTHSSFELSSFSSATENRAGLHFNMRNRSLIFRGLLLLAASVLGKIAAAEGGFSPVLFSAPPTGLAAGAFSDFTPARSVDSVGTLDSALAKSLPRPAGPPASWRSASPLERSMISSRDVDLFPHTRRTVPLLVPAALDVSKQSAAPVRTMSGPTVGVRWMIPGCTP